MRLSSLLEQMRESQHDDYLTNDALQSIQAGCALSKPVNRHRRGNRSMMHLITHTQEDARFQSQLLIGTDEGIAA